MGRHRVVSRSCFLLIKNLKKTVVDWMMAIDWMSCPSIDGQASGLVGFQH